MVFKSALLSLFIALLPIASTAAKCYEHISVALASTETSVADGSTFNITAAVVNTGKYRIYRSRLIIALPPGTSLVASEPPPRQTLGDYLVYRISPLKGGSSRTFNIELAVQPCINKTELFFDTAVITKKKANTTSTTTAASSDSSPYTKPANLRGKGDDEEEGGADDDDDLVEDFASILTHPQQVEHISEQEEAQQNNPDERKTCYLEGGTLTLPVDRAYNCPALSIYDQGTCTVNVLDSEFYDCGGYLACGHPVAAAEDVATTTDCLAWCESTPECGSVCSYAGRWKECVCYADDSNISKFFPLMPYFTVSTFVKDATATYPPPSDFDTCVV